MTSIGPYDGLARFRAVDCNSQFPVASTENGIPYLTGQFWTAKQRQGHSLHEISYRACFKAELPAFFIGHLSQPGETVFDPFSGRGTTMIEAIRLGRKALGNDINPLFPMLCVPRLSAPCIETVIERLAGIDFFCLPEPREGISQTIDDLLTFFHPHTLRQIYSLRLYLCSLEAGGCLDDADGWIRMVALNRLSGHSAGYFSGYTLPPNQATTALQQRRINAKHGAPPPRDVPALILRKSRSLLRSGSFEGGGRCLIGPATDLAEIDDASVDLTVTSPPFLDVIKYDADNWLRSWFAGIDTTQVQISQISSPDAWEAMMRTVLVELARVTREGGMIAFEVGEVRKGKVRLEELVWRAADGLPLIREGVLVNTGAFTKTARIWNVENAIHGTNTNRIVLLRKASV